MRLSTLIRKRQDVQPEPHSERAVAGDDQGQQAKPESPIRPLAYRPRSSHGARSSRRQRFSLAASAASRVKEANGLPPVRPTQALPGSSKRHALLHGLSSTPSPTVESVG